MLATSAALAFAAAGCCMLLAMALRDHRAALSARTGLLQALVPLVSAPVLDVAPDGFPRLSARLPDGRRLRISLVADTLATRRLAQLWLVVSVEEDSLGLRGSIGALARPSGSEFYALTPELPDRLHVAADPEQAVLVRGSGVLSAGQVEAAEGAFRRILSDRAVKEIAATPAGLRLVRQASQGDRAAHIVFRQVRFPITEIAPELLARSLADLEILRSALRAAEAPARKLSA